jgi:hypothetical protein
MSHACGAIWVWNAVGALDLFAAIVLGAMSANGAPLQLIHAGAGSAAVQVLPWALVPAVLVPFYLVTHGIVLAQLLARRPSARVPAHARRGESSADCQDYPYALR